MASIKNVLVFNSSKENDKKLFSIFNELKTRNYFFKFFVLKSELQDTNKRMYFGPSLEKSFGQFLFIIFFPFLFVGYFLFLMYKKINNNNRIVCIGLSEKIVITLVASILKIKIIWIEDASSLVLNKKIIKPMLFFYKRNSKKVSIIVFNNFIKTKLIKAGAYEKNIKIIFPGLKSNKREHQDDLFNEIAQNEGRKYKRKYFTIGTIVELDKKHNIEVLFQAVKHCLSVVPNMQLIIVGEGKERKDLSWLNKKMEIDSITWFVGKQAYLQKWLDSFDVFVVSCEKLNLEDSDIVLQSMRSGLPVIGQKDIGLEDFVLGADQLTEGAGSELIARQIIKIWRDRVLRNKLGKEGKEKVEKQFVAERMFSEFENILG